MDENTENRSIDQVCADLIGLLEENSFGASENNLRDDISKNSEDRKRVDLILGENKQFPSLEKVLSKVFQREYSGDTFYLQVISSSVWHSKSKTSKYPIIRITEWFTSARSTLVISKILFHGRKKRN